MLLTTHADLFEDPHRGEVVGEQLAVILRIPNRPNACATIAVTASVA